MHSSNEPAANQPPVPLVPRIRSTAASGTDPDHQALLEAVIESSNDAIIVVDLDGNITSWNGAAHRLYGYAPEEAIGRSVSITLPPDRLDEPSTILRRLRSGETIDAYDTVRTSKNGSSLEIRMRITPVKDRAGVLIGAAATSREVGAERRLRDNLQRSEQRCFTTLQSINDAVITTDVHGRIISLNPVAEGMTGWTQAEATGKHCWEVFRIIDEDTGQAVENPVTKVLRDGRVTGLANHTILIARDGAQRFIDNSGAPIRGPYGTMLGVVLVFRDVTDKRNEERERETTIEFLQIVNAKHGTRELVEAAAAFFLKHSRCDAAGIRLKEGDDYPYFEARGFSESFISTEMYLCGRSFDGAIVRDPSGNPVLDCMCGNVICGRFDPVKPFFTAQGSFWTNSTTELLAATTEEDRQARTRNRCNGDGYESVALIPLRVGDERIGLLQLNSRTRGMFTHASIASWERLAGYLSLAVSRARAEEHVQTSESKYRMLFENMTEEVHFWEMIRNADGNVVTWKLVDANGPALKTWNKNIAEICGKTTDEIFGAGATAHYMPIVQQLLASDAPVTFEDYFPHLDRYFRFTSSRIGEHFVTTGIDVTEIKRENDRLESRVLERTAALEQANAALAAERRRFYKVLETLPAMICLLTPDRRVAFTNRTFRERFGEDNGRRCYEVCFGRTEPCEVCEAFRVLETGKPHHYEMTYNDGTVVEAYDLPFTDVDGSPMILEMHTDITERKRAEAELARHREHLEVMVKARTAELEQAHSLAQEGARDVETIMDAAPVAMWIAHDPKCERITGNRLGREMLRSAPGKNLAINSHDGGDRDFVPHRNGQPIRFEDLPMFYAASHGVEVRDYEMEIVFKDGSRIHVFGNASPLYGADGAVRGAVGTFLDITERKQHEEEIATLNARLQRAMSETHHRVKNNLQVISALIEMQTDGYGSESSTREMRALGHHIKALAAIHDILTEKSKTGDGVDVLSARAAIDKLLPLFQATLRARRIRADLEPVDIPTRQGGALTLVVNELVTNAVKHGLGDIELTLTGDDIAIRLAVKDNGPGFPVGFDPTQHVDGGVELVMNLSAMDLRGAVAFENPPEGGARAVVTFPRVIRPSVS